MLKPGPSVADTKTIFKVSCAVLYFVLEEPDIFFVSFRFWGFHYELHSGWILLVPFELLVPVNIWWQAVIGFFKNFPRNNAEFFWIETSSFLYRFFIVFFSHSSLAKLVMNYILTASGFRWECWFDGSQLLSRTLADNSKPRFIFNKPQF